MNPIHWDYSIIIDSLILFHKKLRERMKNFGCTMWNAVVSAPLRSAPATAPLHITSLRFSSIFSLRFLNKIESNKNCQLKFHNLTPWIKYYYSQFFLNLLLLKGGVKIIEDGGLICEEEGEKYRGFVIYRGLKVELNFFYYW